MYLFVVFGILTIFHPVPQSRGEYFYPSKHGTRIAKRYFNSDVAWTATDLVSSVKQEGESLIVTISSRTKSLFGDEEIESPTAKYSLSDKGVWKVEEYDIVNQKWNKLKEKECTLMGTPKEGSKWTIDPHYDDGVLFKHTCKIEKITVPAGTFECLVVTGEAVKDGKVIRTGTVWYAKGIGPVRSKHGDKVMMEAIKVNVGK